MIDVIVFPEGTPTTPCRFRIRPIFLPPRKGCLALRYGEPSPTVP